MPVTRADLDQFRAYAIELIDRNEVTTLKECVHCWEDQREFVESVAGIRESLEDIAAGRTKPLDEAISDIRREVGFKA
jgi:predicted transcriptional regulator